MRILNYSIHPANYNKRTPVTLKKIADIILFLTMFLDFITPWLDKMPEINGKVWIVWTISGVALLFKFFTKMVTDAEVYH